MVDPQGMGAVEPRAFLDGSRQLCHVACNDPIHAGLAHALLAKLIACEARAGPGRWGRPRVQPGVCGAVEPKVRLRTRFWSAGVTATPLPGGRRTGVPRRLRSSSPS